MSRTSSLLGRYILLDRIIYFFNSRIPRCVSYREVCWESLSKLKTTTSSALMMGSLSKISWDNNVEIDISSFVLGVFPLDIPSRIGVLYYITKYAYSLSLIVAKEIKNVWPTVQALDKGADGE